MQTFPTYGISSQFEIDLDARLPDNPIDFVSDASNAKSKGRLFMWKLKQLKDTKSSKK